MQARSDIVSISTGRGSFLIGPSSAFGAKRSVITIREPQTIHAVVSALVRQQGAACNLGQLIRRWGIDGGSTLPATADMQARVLDRALMSGRIAIAQVPEVYLGFASGSVEAEAETRAKRPPAARALPESLADRLALVCEMVPRHMDAEAGAAFEDALKGQGTAAIIGVLVRIGIRFIPLLGWAVLAYDVYSTSTEVVEAYEKLSEQIETVRKAENFAELEAVSKEIAAVFNIFFMNGVLSKILGTRAKTKGPDGKPPSSGKPAPKKDPKHDKDDGPGRVREGDAQYTEISAKTAGNDSVPLKNRQVGKSEGKAVRPLDAQYNEEIRDGLQIRRAKYTDVKEGFPTMTASDYATFRTEPVPRTLKPGEKIYRIVGDGSDPNGSYWTTDPPPLTEAEWRANSAVKNDWNGDGGYVEYTVPEGVEIPVWDGVVRAQRSSDRKGVLPGGGNQLFLDGKLLPSGLPIKRTPWNR